MTFAFIDSESFLCVHCQKRRLIAIAYVLYDVDNASIGDVTLHYVQPPRDCVVDNVSFGIHGISREYADLVGKSIASVLCHVASDLQSALVIVAHDVHADVKVLVDEATMANDARMLQLLLSRSFLCTKLMTVAVMRMKMPSKVNAIGWKWPSLKESYAFATNGLTYNEHNPVDDVIACMQVFFRTLGVL